MLTYGGAGSVLSLNETAHGATPNVTISEVAANDLRINLNGQNFDATSSPAAGALSYPSGNPATSTFADINITAANQISTLFANLSGDFLSLGSINNTNGGVSNLSISANFIFVPSSATIDTTNASSNAGNIALTAETIISLNSGSQLLSNNGSITLKANQSGTPTGGNFIAISDSGGTVQTTGGGNILLQGTGSNDVTTGSHIGVLLSNSGATGAVVEATGTGRVTIDGTGGQGTAGNFGVDLTGANTVVSSATRPLIIAGHGGAGVGANSFDVGVNIISGAKVTATGTATVAITGTGGQGTGTDFGVNISGSTTQVSADSTVQITGTGGGFGSGTVQVGVNIGGGAQISATGGLTITGTGGQGTGADFGVLLDGTSSTALTSAGFVQVTGTGGGTATSTTEIGVLASNGVQVTATGTGTVSLTGTGGSGVSGNLGVELTGTGTLVSSASGAISIAGTGGGGAGNTGLNVVTAAQVTATAAPITLSSDSMQFAGSAAISAASNTVTLKPLTPTTQIDLGGANGSGVLGLSAAELNLMTAGTLAIGSTADTGGIVISAALAPANALALDLLTGTTINQSVAGTGITLSTLTATAFHGIGTIANPLAVLVTTLNTDTSGANGNQYLTTAASLSNFQLNAGSGTIDLTGGSFLLTAGDTIAANLLNVDNTALLGGTGKVSESVTVHNGGTLSPGSVTTGTVTIQGNLALLAGSTYFEKLNGTSTGQFDQAVVSGDVSLAGTIAGSVGYASAINDSFQVVQNNGPNPVVGGFSNIVSGSFVTLGGMNFQVSNTGGSGNDVVLTRLDPLAPLFSSSSSAIFAVGLAGTFTVAASGAPTASLTESASDSLPANVTFNSTTGVLSGTPTAGTNGVYLLHFTAANNVSPVATQTFTLFVTSQFSFAGEYGVSTGSGSPTLASITQSGSVLTLTGTATQNATITDATQILVNGADTATYGNSSIVFTTGAFAGQTWTKLDLPPNYTNQTGAATRLIQNGTSLTFVDKFGNQSPGTWTSPTQISASAWGETVTIGTGQLLWQDGSVWSENLRLSGSKAGIGTTTISAAPSSLYVFDYVNGANKAVHLVLTGTNNILFIDGNSHMSLGTFSSPSQASTPFYPNDIATFSNDLSKVTWQDGAVWTKTAPTSAVTVTDYTNTAGVATHLVQNGTNQVLFIDSFGRFSLGIKTGPNTAQADLYPGDLATITATTVTWQDGVVWTQTGSLPLTTSFIDPNGVVSHVKLLSPTSLIGLDGPLQGVTVTRVNDLLEWSNGNLWASFDYNALNALFEMGTGYP